MPSLTDLNIHGYKAHALAIEANINFTNPTNYSATVPFFDINILTNGTLLGNATVENVSVVPGRNENVHVRAKWDPLSLSGESGVKVGRELLSQYVSGMCSITNPLLILDSFGCSAFHWLIYIVRIQHHHHATYARGYRPGIAEAWENARTLRV